jgi:predicted dehydrogenase
LEKPGWHEPISAIEQIYGFQVPLICQIQNFAAVIRGTATPLVTAEDGYKNQQVIEAVKTSVASAQTVFL